MLVQQMKYIQHEHVFVELVILVAHAVGRFSLHKAIALFFSLSTIIEYTHTRLPFTIYFTFVSFVRKANKMKFKALSPPAVGVQATA